MQGANRKGARWAAISVILSVAAALAWPGEAVAWPKPVGPFAYVAGPGVVSVIDTRTNKVATQIAVGDFVGAIQVAPSGDNVYVTYRKSGDANNFAVIGAKTNTVTARLATPDANGPIRVSPDGKSVYLASAGGVTVIDAAANKVTTTVATGQAIDRMVMTQDGRRVYVTEPNANALVAIDTATNKVAATIPLGARPVGLAVTPDGHRAVVPLLQYSAANDVAIIDLDLNNVASTVEADFLPADAAVNPDGRHAYVTGQVLGPDYSLVLTIDLATSQAAAYATVGRNAYRLLVTPDGKFIYITGAYVTYYGEAQGFVSVLDARTNTLVGGTGVRAIPSDAAATPDSATVFVPLTGPFPDSGKVLAFRTATNTVSAAIAGVGDSQGGVAIIPPPPGLPFSAFTATGLGIVHGTTPKMGAFNYYAYFTLGAASNGIHPDVEPVALELGAFSTTIPAGSFVKQADGSFGYLKWINGVLFNAYIRPQGSSRYLIHLSETGLNLPKITNPVQVRQIIGDDSGTVAVKADLN
jgi:YVTN family beta-propeller protein